MGKTYFFNHPDKLVAVNAATLFKREVKRRYGRRTQEFEPICVRGGNYSIWLDVCGEPTPEIDKLAHDCMNYTAENAK